MKYENLMQLIGKSSSSRQYFLSLPVSTQMELHRYNEFIHSAAELHHYVYGLEIQCRQVQNSEYYRFY